ncbi:putative aar2 protein [Diaporthe ampelina]|uniref:Putative aar2 protein n=1 Tax=Diaporthe ampelina TaxID=1214573 RepID=A0A0G2HTS0_9PEZI|nr:putative aar2 protein [Diaporthe ampelina]
METTSLGPPSQENLQSALTDVERPSPVPIPKATLKRTDSAQSSSKASLNSHQSVPVTGTFPLGSLRVHQVMDSPRPRHPQAREPQADLSEMPPLEDSPSRDTPTLGGDIFLILDLPPNSTVGCDARAINTGASGFKGISDIPPGPHFVWVSEPNALSRCGYWFVAQDKATVRVKQWDKYNEVLAEPASRFELRDHRDNVASLYPQLVSFRHGRDPAVAAGAGSDDEAQLWHQLTSGISEGLLARVTGRRDAGEWLVATSDTAQGEAGFPQATTQLYKAVVGPRELEFLFPEGDVDLTAGDADTRAGPPDTSAEILRLVDSPGNGLTEADITGELQLTFLAGLHLSNLSCVDQWWHLVLKAVLRAHRLALLRPRLAAALVRTLHAQMVYDEGYIAGGGAGAATADDDARDQGTSVLDIVPGNKRKLRRALALYRRRLDELLLDLPRGQATSEQGVVGKAFGELEAWFWKFGWDSRTGGVGEEEGTGGEGSSIGRDDDDDDDYKPVIVDLDADGREVGLVSFS